MLSSGTAGRATDLLLTITLVCRRGKYGPRSPENKHIMNSYWLLQKLVNKIPGVFPDFSTLAASGKPLTPSLFTKLFMFGKISVRLYC